MRFLMLLFLFVTSLNTCVAQFSFSGYVNPDEETQNVYLSLVEDYRKLSGVYTEQIIATTVADNDGFFEFKGNMLDLNNRIYRIHVDRCPVNQQNFNHFNGHCGDSETLLFIANNKDTLKLPFSFDNQIFCKITSNNTHANAFLKIDSIKNEMRFTYSKYRSEASRKLNDKRWFKTLQNFGEALDEPLAELCIYAYLSDRKHSFYKYYVEDLKSNSYYTDLRARLEHKYPNTVYTKQYAQELNADSYMVAASQPKTNWILYISIILGVSIGCNIWFLYKLKADKRKKIKTLTERLSKQEKVVLDEILKDKSNKAIASSLFLSVSTVKTHINNIYKKLNVQSRDDVKALFSR